MSGQEPSTGKSSSEGSEDICSKDGEEYYVFNSDLAPGQGEPLASSEDGYNNGGGEDEDEDEDKDEEEKVILPCVSEQRFQVPSGNR